MISTCTTQKYTFLEKMYRPKERLAEVGNLLFYLLFSFVLCRINKNIELGFYNLSTCENEVLYVVMNHTI